MILEIIDYNSAGEGVGKVDGFVYFVPCTIKGETVRARVVKRYKSYARAEIVEVVRASSERVPPECEHFGVCGGCDLLHMTYEEELRFKRGKVASALRILGDVRIVGSPAQRHYRNKTVWQEDDGKIGLYAKGTHDVVGVEHCLLQSEAANEQKELFYRENKQRVCGLEFEVGEKSFFQVNNAAAGELFGIIGENISKDDMVLDLYCGVGAIGLCIAGKAKKVVGVEINERAIEEAVANARRNGIENATFITGKSEDVVNFGEFGVVIVDPPRAGCDKRLIKALRGSGVGKIIYVSCHPATMARDLKGLDNYEIVSVTAVDMFPRTAHVECCVVLRRM